MLGIWSLGRTGTPARGHRYTDSRTHTWNDQTTINSKSDNSKDLACKTFFYVQFHMLTSNCLPVMGFITLPIKHLENCLRQDSGLTEGHLHRHFHWHLGKCICLFISRYNNVYNNANILKWIILKTISTVRFLPRIFFIFSQFVV